MPVHFISICFPQPPAPTGRLRKTNPVFKRSGLPADAAAFAVRPTGDKQPNSYKKTNPSVPDSMDRTEMASSSTISMLTGLKLMKNSELTRIANKFCVFENNNGRSLMHTQALDLISKWLGYENRQSLLQKLGNRRPAVAWPEPVLNGSIFPITYLSDEHLQNMVNNEGQYDLIMAMFSLNTMEDLTTLIGLSATTQDISNIFRTMAICAMDNAETVTLWRTTSRNGHQRRRHPRLLHQPEPDRHDHADCRSAPA